MSGFWRIRRSGWSALEYKVVLLRCPVCGHEMRVKTKRGTRVRRRCPECRKAERYTPHPDPIHYPDLRYYPAMKFVCFIEE